MKKVYLAGQPNGYDDWRTGFKKSGLVVSTVEEAIDKLLYIARKNRCAKLHSSFLGFKFY